ncbi:MAG: diacylglycerol kinase [Magnetococcales bacterium]|nr:diacylglycerol kinase [Magnetococcales bacterium]
MIPLDPHYFGKTRKMSSETTQPSKATGLRRLVLATGYSMAGLRVAWRQEAAFRQEVGLTVWMIPVACWLGTNASQRALLIGSLLLVLITELLNSAIEAAIDRFGTERHPLSGQAKDLGSAAVFVALLLGGVVWGLIALERFI